MCVWVHKCTGEDILVIRYDGARKTKQGNLDTSFDHEEEEEDDLLLQNTHTPYLTLLRMIQNHTERQSLFYCTM